MTAKSEKLLLSLLRPLVEEWGPEAVARSLQRLETDRAALPSQHSEIARRLDKAAKIRKRRHLSELIIDADLPQEKKAALIEIARQYEDRRFLPSLGDVEHFLLMNGNERHQIRDRRMAFKIVLSVITKLPDEVLARVVRGTAYAGPAQLGPLSDAIGAANVAIRMPKGFSEEDLGNWDATKKAK